MKNFELHHGDCLAIMKSMPDNSIDSIVTDPPYGIGFMGKKWDYDVPDVAIWVQCLRVLKPGGHLLSFAGTRTQHRMAVNIEDAGFEIRDMVTFLYDTNSAAQSLIESLTPEQLKLLDASFGRDGMLAWAYGSGFPKSHNLDHPWHGWGTALKPAIEPITVARKPFNGTVAFNMKAHGTAALNIDGCRIELNGDYKCKANGRPSITGLEDNYNSDLANKPDTIGRWPANLIHDGSSEVIAGFPDAKGQQGALTGNEPSGKMGSANCYGKMDRRHEAVPRIETDRSAARFFYCAKTSRKDRHEGMRDPGPQFRRGTTLRKVENAETEGNNHPTVKPTDLMAYLCRLVTPVGGIILDPFMGSGSTGKAAIREGFQFIGIELDEKYVSFAKARIEYEASKI
jgi:site-specific DNA-methyltransferase (adenine-specific)